MTLKPQQRLTESQRDVTWRKETYEYYGGQCKPLIQERDAIMLYRIAEGHFYEQDYYYVMNPLNTSRPELKGYPTRMRNFPIIPPNVKLLVSEKTKRMFKFIVAAINSDLQSMQKELEKELITQAVLQQGINALIEQGVAEEEAMQKPLTYDEIAQKSMNASDIMAELGQEALEYIRYAQEFEDKCEELAYHAIVTGFACTYRGVNNDEVDFQVVPPKEMRIMTNTTSRYIEDMEAVIRKYKMTAMDIMEKFEGVEGFNDDVINRLLTRSGYNKNADGTYRISAGTNTDLGKSYNTQSAGLLWKNLFGTQGYIENDELFNVEHLVFTSFKKRGLVTGESFVSGPYEFYCDEDYKASSDEEVVWKWVKTKREMWIIDADIIVGSQELAFTRASMENPSEAKNPYNGIIIGTPHVDPISVVRHGIPYQIKHNIINWHIEKTLAKNRDKFLIMPLSLIPNKEGQDQDSTVYHIDASGILWVNDKKKDALQAMQAIKILDASLTDAIRQMVEYANSNRAEYDEMLGISRQRKGQTFASDAKGVTEEAIFRSTMMSEYLFNALDKLHKRDLQALIDFSQIAYIKGKKAAYVNSKNKIAYLQLNPEKHCFAKYSVFVVNSQKELEKKQKIDAMAFAYAQDPNVKKSTSAEVIMADNVSEAIHAMKRIEAELDAKMGQAQEAGAQAEQEKVNIELMKFEEEMKFKYYEVDQDNLYKDKINLDKLQADLLAVNSEIAGTDNFVELEKLSLKRFELAEKIKSKDKEIQLKEKELATKKEIAEKQLKVARVNKN
jgi:hypothetical protein